MSNKADRQIIEQAIDALGGIFPMWADRSKNPDTRYTWYRGLARADLTKDEIKAGIIKAERHDSQYAPSLGVFVGWCQGKKELTPAQAYQEAAMSKFTSPEAIEAARRTGQYDLRNNPSRDIRRLFEDHYKDVLSEKADGKVFDLPKPEEKPRHIAYSPDVSKEESDSTVVARTTFAALKKKLSEKAEESTNVDTKLES